MQQKNTNRLHEHKKQSRGFTLMEIMIAVAIAAILLAIAVPNFRFQIEQGRFTSTSNELVTALNYARGEAIRRSRPVSVSRVGTTWQDGWTAFIDPARTGAIGAQPKLREGTGVPFVMQGATKLYSVDVTGAPPFVLFDSSGRRRSDAASAFVSFDVFKSGALSTARRVVCVSQSGRIFVAKGGAPCN